MAPGSRTFFSTTSSMLTTMVVSTETSVIEPVKPRPNFPREADEADEAGCVQDPVERTCLGQRLPPIPCA